MRKLLFMKFYGKSFEPLKIQFHFSDKFKTNDIRVHDLKKKKKKRKFETEIEFLCHCHPENL